MAASLPPAPDVKKQGVKSEKLAPVAEEPPQAIAAAKLDRLVTSVKTAVSDDPALVAGVLRNWLEERP